MKVLSLFDGMACGYQALKELNIKVDKYYSSEIDKYAAKIAKKNHEDIVELGDITLWNSWNVNFKEIDLVFAGFPCQAWSVAGKGGGKEDERGALAWTMMDIFNHIRKLNPNVKFLFENVRMKKEFLEEINELIGVEPILINSALVSAQNRQRYYWSNIEKICLPRDRGVEMKDIIEHGEVDRNKAYCIDANYFKGTNLNQYLKKCRRQIVFNYSSSGRGNGAIEDRAYVSPKKSHTLTKTGYSKRSFTGIYNKENIRKLTPLECERLQTLPEGYTEGVSNTQRYKMLGNGWTVEVIKHILKGLK